MFFCQCVHVYFLKLTSTKGNLLFFSPSSVYICVPFMRQVWQVSWCALQVCQFAWLELQSPYCTHHPSTRVTWSLCPASTACAAKRRKSTWREVSLAMWEDSHRNSKKAVEEALIVNCHGAVVIKQETAKNRPTTDSQQATIALPSWQDVSGKAAAVCCLAFPKADCFLCTS